MMAWGKEEKKEERSVIDQLLSSFTKNAREMNAIAGFPGVLLLVGILAIGLPALPGFEESTGLMFVAGICILCSAITYAVQWWFMAKQAEAHAILVTRFTHDFLQRYLDSKNEFEAEHVDWAIRNIINKLSTPIESPNNLLQPNAKSSAE